MSEKDLIPLKKKEDCTPEELVRQEKVWSKLKGTASAKRKIAQKITGLKRAKPENIEKKLIALITDPSISALEIMKMIEFLKTKEDMRTETFIQLINSAIKAHSTIFGNKNFNVNVDVTPDSARSMNSIFLEVQNERTENIRKKRKRDTEGSDKE